MDAKDPMPGLRPGLQAGSQPAISPTAPGAAGGARLQTSGMPGAARQANGVLFSRQLAALRQAEPASGAVASTAPSPPAEVVVQRGDTLTSLVRARWVALGGAREALSAPEAHRWALQVARDNGLTDPDRIQVGQNVVVGS
ncbi:MAG: LysM peptidoglycan-binding domain-containing protein, partial [Betaproteobacteria bacterium]